MNNQEFTAIYEKLYGLLIRIERELSPQDSETWKYMGALIQDWERLRIENETQKDQIRNLEHKIIESMPFREAPEAYS